METLLNKIKGLSEKTSKVITYSEIESHPIGRKIEILPGIFTERLPSMYDVLFFKVTQAKGTVIPNNIHDCIEEIAVGEGRIIEKLSGRILNQYDSMRIPVNKPHAIEAAQDSIWYAHLYLRN